MISILSGFLFNHGMLVFAILTSYSLIGRLVNSIKFHIKRSTNARVCNESSYFYTRCLRFLPWYNSRYSTLNWLGESSWSFIVKSVKSLQIWGPLITDIVIDQDGLVYMSQQTLFLHIIVKPWGFFLQTAYSPRWLIPFVLHVLSLSFVSEYF